MLGGMLAGHDESGGELIEDGGGSYKSFYGMSSAKAMETHYGEIADHRAPEGKEVRVPYRGPLEVCLLYTSPSPRDLSTSRMPSSA